MSRWFAGREVGVINLIQLQTRANSGHRFYYHSVDIHFPIFLTLQKKKRILEVTTGLTLRNIIWILWSLVNHVSVAKRKSFRDRINIRY